MGDDLLENISKQQIWAIGGGKGGIGKSFIISNLAISLAKMGKSVVIVDLDLGSANLHTCLGCPIPKLTLSDFLSGRTTNISELVVKTPIAGLSMISGANDSFQVADIQAHQHKLLQGSLRKIPCDYLLLDLGAGTHESTLDYFLMADRPIIALTPEPTSIENAYRFIRSAYYKHIKVIEKSLGIYSLVNQVMDQKNLLGIKTPADLVKKISEMNPEFGQAFNDKLAAFKIYLVLNQVRTKSDADVGLGVKSICKKYFGIDTYFSGYLNYDNVVWQAIRQYKPIVLEYPNSEFVIKFNQLAKTIDDNERLSRTKLLRVA